MKPLYTITLALGLLAFAGVGCKSTGSEPAAKAGPIENTRCPYDARPVDAGYTAEYEGKTIALCSKACQERWAYASKEDRARYWKQSQ